MIDNLLLDCFKEQGRLALPGKGIVLHVNIEDRGLDTVAFVCDSSVDGSEITEYLCKVLDTDTANADKILKGYIALMDSLLLKNGEYSFEGIGILRLDDKGAIYLVNRPSGEQQEGKDSERIAEKEKLPISDTDLMQQAFIKKEYEEMVKAEEVYQGDMTEDSELSEQEPPVLPVVDSEQFDRTNEDKCTLCTESKPDNADGSVDCEQVKELLSEMRDDMAEESAINEVKRHLEEKERHERLSEIFTSRRCFNDELGDRRGEVSTLQMRLNNNEESHIRSEKIEDLYKGDRHVAIAGEKEELKKDENMKTDVPTTPVSTGKKKKRLDTVWIIFIIAVLGLIGVTIYYLYEKNVMDGNINVPAVEEVVDQPVM